MQIREIKAEIHFPITDEDVTDLMVTALEGGIGYWSCLDNSGPEFESAPEEETTSEAVARILMEGREIKLLDEEDHDTVWILTLEKLFKGVRLFIEKGYDQYGAVSTQGMDLAEIDADCADSIVQLALFDEIVFG